MSDEKHEQHSETDSEFDQAFNEAAEGKPEHADTSKAEAGEQDKPAATGEAADDGAPTDTPDDGAGAEQDGETDWQAKYEQERAEREKAEQRMKSWEGRLKKSNDQLAREQSARQRMEAQLRRMENREQAGDREQLEAFIEEWDGDAEMAPVVNLVRAQLQGMGDPADTGDQPAGEADQGGEPEANAPDTQAHFDAISAKHADWQTIVASGQLQAWIESLPGSEALKYSRIAESGTAEQVIAMFDAMKAAPAAEAETGDNDDTTNDADDAEAMAAVRHRSGGRRGSGRKEIPKDDFDGAWEAAVRED